MSAPQEKERYLIIFNFGSFVYMFFIIGFSAGLVAASIDGVINLFTHPTLSATEITLLNLVSMPFGFGFMLAFFGAFGFLPYRWLCKRGWGWPTKGIFIKVQEQANDEL